MATQTARVPVLDEDGRFPDAYAPISVAVDAGRAESAAEAAETARGDAQGARDDAQEAAGDAVAALQGIPTAIAEQVPPAVAQAVTSADVPGQVADAVTAQDIPAQAGAAVTVAVTAANIPGAAESEVAAQVSIQVDPKVAAASGYAEAAAESASGAAGSASEASTSASAADGSATAAETARDAAQTARTGAETARTGAESARDETIVAVAAQSDWSGAVTLTAAQSRSTYLRRRLTGNVTLTPAPGDTGKAYSCTLELAQDATGSRTITIVNAATAYAVAITLSTAANAVDVIRLEWNGTRWAAFLGAAQLGIPAGWIV